LRLVGHIAKTNRNTTTNILFSCLEVFDKLTEKGLTFVGTIKENKRSEFLPHRNKEPCVSIYGFVWAKMLLSYVPKKNRAVLLISSRNHSACNDPVDTLDQKWARY